MTGQAFDTKNQLDYDKYTELLVQGIMQIASDANLKPTVAELSRITGIHRNTIRQRQFPLARLEAIKDNRRIEVLAQKAKAEKKKDTKTTTLMQSLVKSRLEVIYWFNKYKESESSWASLNRRFTVMRESMDYYKKLASDLRFKVSEQDTEIQKLRDALHMVSANIEESK